MKSPDGRHELVDPAYPELGWKRSHTQRITRASQQSQGVMVPKRSWLLRKSHTLVCLGIAVVAAIRAAQYYGVNRHG